MQRMVFIHWQSAKYFAMCSGAMMTDDSFFFSELTKSICH